MNKVYCKDCVRWYCTGADQCDLPVSSFDMGFKSNNFEGACGNRRTYKPTPEQIKFARDRLHYPGFGMRGKLYGHPSELNYDNTCPFYKPAPFKFLTWLWRMF